ncbi:DnaD domain protein [Streptococcus parasanguinis]|uniref:DnaD domain protein n=1 Tax=Streptococcus parasanguinis TaxID=1318 RepID=UPI0012BBB88B|nr:DnaD domain protein [Streptococcus parasanguinis]MTR54183.1 DnaD domain protein [Streptococcus parasanguinis]MTR56123.1 DnaD domain protein [Streptococcus parasanguinis]MTR60755.1 DnaD domain protein [Streptococcus parasanguinis]MTR69994.1 DnaD domain protein [Streptococcus parasanguinis]MTS02484.1 DnaD domain protein [Streptococcus parasanguinis]
MPLKIDDYKDFEMFYKLPQELFDECFKGLSIGAKVLYAILRDKWGQSQKNGWHDENGIYCNFSVKLLSEIMGCSEKTTISYKKELSNYHLISERRQFNSTNKIYVNRVSEAKRYVHEDFTCTEVKNLHHVHEDFTCTEVKNLQSNQTNINQTNLTKLNNNNTVKKIEENFGRFLSPIEIETVNFWEKEYDNDLIDFAIKEAVMRNKRTTKWIDTSLFDWVNKNGLKTVSEIKEYLTSKAGQNSRGKQRKSEYAGTYPIKNPVFSPYTDLLPWEEDEEG